MINQIFTFSAAQLNGASVSAPLQVSGILNTPWTSPGTNVVTKLWNSPRELQFINKTLGDVKVNILANPNEILDYALHPSLYPGFTVAPSSTTGEYETWSKEDCLPNTQLFLVSMASGVTASGVFSIECLDYQEIF